MHTQAPRVSDRPFHFYLTDFPISRASPGSCGNLRHLTPQCSSFVFTAIILSIVFNIIPAPERLSARMISVCVPPAQLSPLLCRIQRFNHLEILHLSRDLHLLLDTLHSKRFPRFSKSVKDCTVSPLFNCHFSYGLSAGGNVCSVGILGGGYKPILYIGH